jgi:hypothetical protein
MTWLPRSPGSILVLWLNQETVHDFILPFLPPCGPHLTPLATGSLEPSLLVFSTPGGLTDNDLLRLFFSCTNTSQAATCTTILRQESVHTTLSITNHTRKRPSTGPRTTHSPHLCYTGQTDGLRRSDRWTEPVRPVTAAAAQQVFQRASVTYLGPGTETPPKHNLQGRRTLHKTKQNTSKPAKN